MKENIRYVVDVSIPDPFPGKKRNIKRRVRSAPRKGERIILVTDRADTREEMIDRILADGWILVRIRGNHHHYKHRSKPGLVTIPHPRKDLGTGVFRNILRQAGLV